MTPIGDFLGGQFPPGTQRGCAVEETNPAPAAHPTSDAHARDVCGGGPNIRNSQSHAGAQEFCAVAEQTPHPAIALPDPTRIALGGAQDSGDQLVGDTHRTGVAAPTPGPTSRPSAPIGSSSVRGSTPPASAIRESLPTDRAPVLAAPNFPGQEATVAQGVCAGEAFIRNGQAGFDTHGANAVAERSPHPASPFPLSTESALGGAQAAATIPSSIPNGTASPPLLPPAPDTARLTPMSCALVPAGGPR